MDAKPWKARVREEEQLLERLNQLASESAKRRAKALNDGVQETGSIAEVARELGKSWNAVYNAIKKHYPQAAKPAAETTE